MRSRDHLSGDVIDAVAYRANFLELDGLGTNSEKESFSTSKTHRVKDFPARGKSHQPRVPVKEKSVNSE